jgi:hypothetical protein
MSRRNGELQAIVESVRSRQGVVDSFLDQAANAIKQAKETP